MRVIHNYFLVLVFVYKYFCSNKNQKNDTLDSQTVNVVKPSLQLYPMLSKYWIP